MQTVGTDILFTRVTVDIEELSMLFTVSHNG